MVIKIKNIIKEWFFPEKDVFIFSSKEELMFFNIKTKKTTRLPIDGESLEQLTVTEDYLIYGEEEVVRIYEYPSLRKIRDSTMFDLTLPTAQITNYKNMFLTYGEDYSVLLVNPLTDEIVRQFPLPKVFHMDDIFLCTYNYTHDYLIAFVEYLPFTEEIIPKKYKKAWESRNNYINFDEGYQDSFYAIWNFHSGKFYAAIGSESIDYSLPKLTETEYLIVDNKIFDLKELKLVHQFELPEHHYLIGAIGNYLISLHGGNQNELLFYDMKEQKPLHNIKTNYKIGTFVNNSRYVWEYRNYKASEFPNIIDLKTFLAKLK